MIPLLLLGLFGAVALSSLLPSARSSQASIYVDKNGVPWTIYFDTVKTEKWHALDKQGRYGNGPWDVSSSTGTRQQAIAAADFYAQEHKPVK